MSNTTFLFLILFFLGLILAFVRHPIYGVYSYMLVLYMGPGEAWWSESLPDLRWSLLAASVSFLAILLHPKIPRRPPWYQYKPIRWLVVFSLWLWVQMFWSLNKENQLFLSFLFTKYVFLYIILYSSFTDISKIRKFFFAHIIGCFYWGLIAYQNPGSGRLEKIGFGDLAGSAFSSMQISTGLAFAGYAFLFIIGIRSIKKWIALFSIPFMLNAIILMATRGAFVGLIGGALVSFFFSPKSKRPLIVICLILAGILLAYLANDLFWGRMSTIPVANNGGIEASAASRVDIARANLRMSLDYPLGVGHRGNDLLSPIYMPKELLAYNNKSSENIRSAHNTVMAILVDHSLLGLLLIVFFHWNILQSLIKMKKINHNDQEINIYIAAFGTSLIIYWINAQFANFIKSEIIIWIAAMIASLEWMTQAKVETQRKGSFL